MNTALSDVTEPDKARADRLAGVLATVRKIAERDLGCGEYNGSDKDAKRIIKAILADRSSAIAWKLKLEEAVGLTKTAEQYTGELIGRLKKVVDYVTSNFPPMERYCTDICEICRGGDPEGKEDDGDGTRN